MRFTRYLAALLLSLGAALASATTYRELSLDELLSRAELAFYGTVAGLSSEARGGEPYTVVTFDVAQALRGELDAQVALAFYGGTLPSAERVEVAGMPSFEPGEEVLVLAYDAPYYSPIVGFSQGLWRVTAAGLTDETGRVLSLSAAGALTLDGEGGGLEDILAALQTRLEAAP